MSTLWIAIFDALFAVLCYWVGFLLGRKYEARKWVRNAPLPVINDYNINNPINGRARETVEMNGAVWYKMN